MKPCFRTPRETNKHIYVPIEYHQKYKQYIIQIRRETKKNIGALYFAFKKKRAIIARDGENRWT